MSGPRPPVALLVVRALGGPVLGTAALATIAIWAVVPERPIAVLGQSDVFAVIWPLVPAVFALAVPSALAPLRRDLEATGAWPRLALRLGLLGAVGVGAAAVVAMGTRVAPAIALRNTAFLVGLALLGAIVLPARWAWAPVVVAPVTMWLVGALPAGRSRPWAVLLRPAADHAASAASWACLLAGSVACLTVAPRRADEP